MKDSTKNNPPIDPPDHRKIYGHSFWIAPGIAIITCKECGSWIDPEQGVVHYNFHRKLEVSA